MKFRPDEAMLMAYLYDELDQEARLKVEAYLQEHPEVMHELQGMQAMRMLMSNLRDKEVIEPPIIQTKGNGAWRVWEWKPFRAVVGIAATLLILLLAGKWSGVEVSAGHREFRISFAGTSTNNVADEKFITKDEVNSLIQSSLSKYELQLDEQWQVRQTSLNESISKNLAQGSKKIDAVLSKASNASEEQIRQYVESLQRQNMMLMQDYLALTSTEQKQYMENLLVDFAAYLQQQRSDDLRYLQARMNLLEEDTDLFKLETEQILTSIVSNVSNTNNY